MTELQNDLSTETLHLLSRVVGLINVWHQMPLNGTPGEDPVRERLIGLAESLIVLFDCGEFGDVEHAIYELRHDPEEDERDLAALLSLPLEPIERAMNEAYDSAAESLGSD